uniref:Ig-like domain-containing protein n=1 Tax=Sphaeramia orbicularis TaxID=375764 RepID=A0A673BEJ4_9TELE
MRIKIDMSCTYTYPQWINNWKTTVEKTFWFINSDIKPVDLKTKSEYKGRVYYSYKKNDCFVRISDLRQSDSAQYQFSFMTNQPGGRYTGSPGVTLTVTVSFSPSGEIIEGSSVTLTCTSDANPPVTKYTWYKRGKNQLQSRGEGQQFVLSFINSSDSGSYSCQTENSLGLKMSEYVYINVKYPPRLPSVSVSPSGQIVEGSSVTLTCTSDANPPVTKYTWYKEDEDSPKASGQNFTITDFRSEHSGNYYCEAQNSRGRQNSTSHLVTVSGRTTFIMNIIRLALVFLLLIPLIFLTLQIRYNHKSNQYQSFFIFHFLF